jgi:hypothetical protein
MKANSLPNLTQDKPKHNRFIRRKAKGNKGEKHKKVYQFDRDPHTGRFILPAYVEEYKNAFLRHYPDKDLQVLFKKKVDGTYGFKVAINGDAGDLILSPGDIMDATMGFNK